VTAAEIHYHPFEAEWLHPARRGWVRTWPIWERGLSMAVPPTPPQGNICQQLQWHQSIQSILHLYLQSDVAFVVVASARLFPVLTELLS